MDMILFKNNNNNDVGIAQVDSSSLTLGPLLKASGKKMILLKTLNSEIVHLMQDPENHAQVSRTYSLRPNKGVPPGSTKPLGRPRLLVGNHS